MSISNITEKKRRRVFVAVGVGVGVAAVALASAAGLGGIVVEQIGAESAVVADPFTDGVTVTWGAPVYNAATQSYVVQTFTVSRDGGQDIPAGNMRVAVADENGTALGEGTAVTDGTSNSQVFTLATGVPVRDIENVAVVLHNLP